MIIRLTKKTMKKIKNEIYDLEMKDEKSIPLSEWFINHFTLNRKGYFIITESKSLYSIVEPSVGISNLIAFKKYIIQIIRKFEQDMNLEINSIDTKKMHICKTNNRSIIGSQNDLIKMAEGIFYYDDENYDDLTRINNTPLSYTKSCPKYDIKEEIRKRRLLTTAST